VPKPFGTDYLPPPSPHLGQSLRSGRHIPAQWARLNAARYESATLHITTSRMYTRIPPSIAYYSYDMSLPFSYWNIIKRCSP
jgi:hypothetical protein